MKLTRPSYYINIDTCKNINDLLNGFPGHICMLYMLAMEYLYYYTTGCTIASLAFSVAIYSNDGRAELVPWLEFKD